MSITVQNARYNPDGDHFIVADAEMDDNGNVVLHVFLTCTQKFVGFTAGIMLTYADAAGNKLGQSQMFTLPCGNAPLFSAAHASATFTDKAPAGTVRLIVTETAQVSDLLQAILNDVKVAIEAVGGVVELIAIFAGGALAGKGSNTEGDGVGVEAMVQHH